MKILKRFNNYVKENIEIDDMPSTDSLEDINDEVDMSEEEDTYLGEKLLQELADKLGTEVQNNQIDYNGVKINFFSETEKFHIGSKKFSSVEEVLDFLNDDMPKNEKFRNKKMFEGSDVFDDSSRSITGQLKHISHNSKSAEEAKKAAKELVSKHKIKDDYFNSESFLDDVVSDWNKIHSKKESFSNRKLRRRN
jgi:hypothetical protein